MGKAIVKYLHDRGEDPRGMADGVDSPCMETKGCSQTWKKKQRCHIAESRSEDVREDYG